MRQTSEFITGQISKSGIRRIVSDNFWFVAETPSVFQTGYVFQVGFGLLKKHWPKVYRTVLLFNGKGYFWFFANEKDSLEVGKMLYEGFLKDEDFIYSKKEAWGRDLVPFRKKISGVFHTDLSNLGNNDLANMYRGFMASFYKAWTIPLILEMNTVYVEQVIAPKVRKHLGLSEGEFNEIFAIASQPSAFSFLINERVDFLRLALNFSNAGLNHHHSKYYWIKTSYRRKGDYSVAEISRLINDETNKGKEHIKNELRGIEETPENVAKKRKKLVEKYKISSDDQKRFEAMRIFGDWQDKRKEINIQGNHHLFLLLDEVGKRFDIDVDLIAHSFPSEVIDALRGEHKFDKKELEKRFDLSFQATTQDLKEIFLTSKEAKELKEIIDKKIDNRFKEIKGMTASVGKRRIVKGRVKVVLNPSEISIPEGSILVAPMTRPDFVHLMKNAAAIVTDQGGVTSHAAIVSRELQIPCIVGTGIATKLLKDGDSVEVDTQTGVVTKLT